MRTRGKYGWLARLFTCMMTMKLTVVFYIASCLLFIHSCIAASYAESLIGQLNVISHNESIEIFYITLDDVTSVFSAPLNLPLRPPCPSCHPSYNFVSFDDQLLIPSSQLVTVFTFIDEEPYVYTQVVALTNCEPLSLVKLSLSPDLIFIDCKDLENSDNYFLARLERSSNDNGNKFWTFQRVSGFENLEQYGAYVEVVAFNSVMVLYVHAVGDYIEMNGLLSGYVNILFRPSNCDNIARMTAIDGRLLLECSNIDSDLVTSLHMYSLDSATITHLITTSPYRVCPIRFTPDGEFAALFTDGYIIVIDMVTGNFANVSVNQPIYDGVITRSVTNDSSFYLVYSTPSGLYRYHLTQSRHQLEVAVELDDLSEFADASGVCVHQGCPLLSLVDTDIVMIALDNDEIMTLSVSSLQSIGLNVKSEYQPSRIVFLKKNVSHVPSACEPLRTVTATVREPLATVHILSHGYVSKSDPQITVAVAVAPVIVIIVAMTLIVMIWKRHRLKWSLGNSDQAQLLSEDSVTSSDQPLDSQVSDVNNERKESREPEKQREFNEQEMVDNDQILDSLESEIQLESRGLDVEIRDKVLTKSLNESKGRGSEQQLLSERNDLAVEDAELGTGNFRESDSV